LRSTLRPGDTVARLGGDEFVAVCDGLDDQRAARAIADRMLSVLREPYQVNGATYALSASIGVSLSTSSTQAHQFLTDADQAMYCAKKAGKGRVRFGSVDDSAAARSAGAARAMRIEAELEQALEDDALIFFGQPVIDLRSRRVVAVETLMRWRHPELGLLSPRDFLDVAEVSDLMLPIGSRVLAESCRLAALWADRLGSAAPAVHVNVSGRQLEAGDLSSEVRAALDRHCVPPSQLVLELTETHMPLFADSLRSDLQSLRERGVKIAIDDLGTGYSSLTRITELPVDILKIDLSFVGRMASDPASAAVVRGILAIGSALGLDVVAEGVETPEQERQLQDYGCDLVQGYLYSRPQPETELLRYLLDGQSPGPNRRGQVIGPRSGGDVRQQGQLRVGQGEVRAGQ
jgi:predicted signal transduction protein with EAL and GGDEF domain